MQQHFTPDLLEFLLDLRANNDREWFAENKGRYERHVKEPLLAFIEDFEPYLHSISEHFVADARANGGSMFRIYRDVRFSKDKSPYKTQAAVQFRHEAGRSVHAPGFYLHLEPDVVFAGVGLWRPDSAALARIRERIVDDPVAWQAAAGDPGFVEEFDLEGESLKRPPKGFDPEHPLIEDLKRKDHVGTCMFDEDEATAPGFIDVFADACRTSSPYMEFLTAAVGLPY
ncbi:MAG: DUF2461 domain-containing protein [Acidimicrobiia bacterium]|nr:DUF2461 domain-containing protein [Acidimicrobiia bacterium]MYC45475.1 DUF2461 domain-containing protein [Acidimicrobiia bacterium]